MLTNWEIILIAALGILASGLNVDLANNASILLLLLLILMNNMSSICSCQNRLTTTNLNLI